MGSLLSAQCLRSWEACFYFSATSYSTVGYGDIVLPPVWRLLGPLEAIMGVLMCGISVSVLFAIATRLIGNEAQLAAGARS
jgi:voltage-gated potassium channel